MFALVLVTHFVFGLAPEQAYDVKHGGTTIAEGLTPSPGGIVQFHSDLRGEFEVVPSDGVGEPTGNVPPAECPANLVVINVNVGGARLCGPGAWTGEYQIRNIGAGAAPASTVGISVVKPGVSTPIIKPNQSCPALAPGETSPVLVFTIEPEIPSNATQYLVNICADKSGVVEESNETDNCY